MGVHVLLNLAPTCCTRSLMFQAGSPRPPILSHPNRLSNKMFSCTPSPIGLLSLQHSSKSRKYPVPSYATTEPVHIFPSGHCLVLVMLLCSFFVLFTCQFTVPHGDLLYIFRLGTPTARGPVGADQTFVGPFSDLQRVDWASFQELLRDGFAILFVSYLV